jgi:hypothetical protein
MNERLRCKAQVANAAWQGYRVLIVGDVASQRLIFH